MNIEFHYYITFILCRKAGFSPDESYIIAYSSQYTDDNTFHYHVNLHNGTWYFNEISQTMDITKPSEKRQKIYPIFHFIPGGKESSKHNEFCKKPNYEFTTIPDSQNARGLFDNALKSKNLYRIGIALHAYADTWAHQNFLGYKHKANARSGFGPLFPNIGHADFLHEPDEVHNKWKDSRLKNIHAEINNDQRFLDAAQAIFTRLWRFKNPGASHNNALAQYSKLKLKDKLQDAMDDTYFWGSDEKSRIKAYKKIAVELDRKKYRYDPKQWRHDAVDKEPLETDIFDRYWAKNNFSKSSWYLFQQAVKAHKEKALTIFKPLYKKVGLAI